MILVRSELPSQGFNQLFPNRPPTLFGHIRTRTHIGRIRTMGGCDLVTSLAFGSYSTIYELFPLQLQLYKSGKISSISIQDVYFQKMLEEEHEL